MAPAMGSYEGEEKRDDIPILDLSRCGDERYLESLREACEELGCFRIINHGISPDLLLKADQVCREVFKLPTETKKKNISPIPYAGYYGGIPHVPFYESLGIALSSTRDSQAVTDFTHLMWPHGNQNFSETMEEYICKMMVLLDKVHKVILESFGVGKYYSTDFEHKKGIFRMNLYELSTELPTETLGLSPHTDGNSITILHEDACGGFQICNKEGNWIDVKPILTRLWFRQAWSNGRIPSVKHQVMVKRKQSRLCLGIFNLFPDDMEIKAPLELIDDKHPQLYKTYKFGDLVKFRSGEGNGKLDALHHFASINV